MAFLNYSSSVVTDSYGSLYNFLWTKDGIILTYHDKVLGKSHRSIVVKDSYDEFDVLIDSKDNIYLICQKKDGSLVLETYTYGNWNEEIVLEGDNKKIYNINISNYMGKLNVIYCKSVDEKNNKYVIYHSFKDRSGWITNDIDTINKIDILNPFEVISSKKSIYLGYYDVANNCEEIFIRKYNYENIIWDDKIQVTSSGNKKLYLDMLMEGNRLHITYCEYGYGNFVVKYDKFEVSDEGLIKVKEESLSNPENCSYPTFIIYDNKIWNVWTEFNRVVSSYSSDRGETWEGPYLWKESVNKKFIRHKFSSNDKKLNKNYSIKYSFGKPYPEITFLGFGTLNNTELIPKKKESGGNIELEKAEANVEDNDIDKYNDEYRLKGKIYRNYYEGEDNVESKNYNENIETELNKLKKQIKELNHRINYLEEIYQGNGNKDDKASDDYSERLSKVEDKVNDIEDYLVRRRRGPLFSR